MAKRQLQHVPALTEMRLSLFVDVIHQRLNVIETNNQQRE